MDNVQNVSGMPLLGDRMPEFSIQTTHGMKNFPQDYKGKWIVLFSHPGDFTPVCTTEFVAFAKREAEFKKLNAELVGLSIDQVFSHIKWVEWIEEKLQVKIPFPIIADDTGNVAKKLGMLHPGKGANTVRAVFIVDPNGNNRLIMYYPQEIGRQVDEILRALKAMQIADANKVAMPENWPNNELLKDKVIVPPAKDMETAMKRKGEKDSYDWWFVYKSL
ncbi:MAG: peroxiredoxin [Candidatus Riflebacteria bacterium]|nr:peroxiredoxin [Candidatus Riflebacteria bacterium]